MLQARNWRACEDTGVHVLLNDLGMTFSSVKDVATQPKADPSIIRNYSLAMFQHCEFFKGLGIVINTHTVEHLRRTIQQENPTPSSNAPVVKKRRNLFQNVQTIVKERLPFRKLQQQKQGKLSQTNFLR